MLLGWTVVLNFHTQNDLEVVFVLNFEVVDDVLYQKGL